MNDIYLTQLKGLRSQTLPQLASSDQLSFKGVFGDVGGYIDGKIFISCGNFGIALRLPPAALQAYEDERRDVTNKIVLTNREQPPDYIIETVEN